MLDWPRQDRLLSTLASTLDAGLPPDRALALAGDAAGGRPGRRARAAAQRITTGTPLAEALVAAGEDQLICAVLRAGERTGGLPALCRQLAGAYALRASLRDEVVGRLAYPVLLIHAALLLAPLPWVIAGDLPGWSMAIGPLLPALGLALLAAIACWSGRAGLLARLALRRPLAGLCLPALAADAAAVLAAALAAGLLVPDALELAADACANRQLAGRLRDAAQAVRAGRLPDLAAALAACGLVGDLLDLVRAGEVSGKLDQALAQVRTIAAERFAGRLRWTARLVTGTIYALAMLLAAAAIFAMYGKVYGGLLRELD